MKGLTAIAVLTAAGGFLAPSALGQTYVSGGYTMAQADAAGSDVTFGALTVRVGQELNPNLAIEAEATFGIDDDTYTEGLSLPVEASLESQLGVFVVGKLPVSGVGAIFGRLGYANTSIDQPGSSIDDGDGFAAGAGVELDFIPGITTRLEYTDYFQTKVQTFSLTAGVKF